MDRAVRTFGTTSAEILALGDWLAEAGVTHVGMESTGVYWRPIWALLADRFTLVVANAAHVKAIPRRKTDVRDAEWLADLLQHGLLRASFVPDRPQQELRDLTRQRTALRRDRAVVVNRLHKTLDGANLRLGTVITDITDVSGRAILEALVAGETDPLVLADLAVGRARTKRAELVAVLAGRSDAHLRLLIGQHLAQVAFLDAQVAELEAAITAHPAADQQLVERLDTIPGVGPRVAEVILAEVGAEVNRFPSAQHLTSWAGLCPGQDESAGKRRSGKTRKGNRALRTALVEAAQAAGRSRTSVLGQRYRRLQTRLGSRKAVVALARQILEIVWHLVRDGTVYAEPVPSPAGPLRQRLDQRRHVQALEALGFQVSLHPTAT
jgi:transposase